MISFQIDHIKSLYVPLISVSHSLRLEDLKFLQRRALELSVCVLEMFPGSLASKLCVFTWIVCLPCVDLGIGTDKVTRAPTLQCTWCTRPSRRARSYYNSPECPPWTVGCSPNK